MVQHQTLHQPTILHYHTCNPSTDVIIDKPFWSENRFHCTVAYSRVRAPTLLAQVTVVAEENWKLSSIEFIVSWVDFLLVVESAFSSIHHHSQVRYVAIYILISGSPLHSGPSPIPFPSSSSHLSPCQSMSYWQVAFADVGFIWEKYKGWTPRPVGNLPRGGGGVPRPAPRCGEGGFSAPARPVKIIKTAGKSRGKKKARISTFSNRGNKWWNNITTLKNAQSSLSIGYARESKKWK